MIDVEITNAEILAIASNVGENLACRILVLRTNNEFLKQKIDELQEDHLDDLYALQQMAERLKLP